MAIPKLFLSYGGLTCNVYHGFIHLAVHLLPHDHLPQSLVLNTPGLASLAGDNLPYVGKVNHSVQSKATIWRHGLYYHGNCQVVKVVKTWWVMWRK